MGKNRWVTVVQRGGGDGVAPETRTSHPAKGTSVVVARKVKGGGEGSGGRGGEEGGRSSLQPQSNGKRTEGMCRRVPGGELLGFFRSEGPQTPGEFLQKRRGGGENGEKKKKSKGN